jgi:type IX secretion system PorP/SprF family membrane protein
MQYIKSIYFLVLVCLLFHNASAQDASFSQFFSNQLSLNPAFVGDPKYQRAQVMFRNQWLTTKSPYITYGFSYDRFFIEQNSGLGINIVNDMQAMGALNWLSMSLLYSHTVQVAYNAQIRGGIQVGTIVKSQNTKDLIFPDMIDPFGEIIGSPNFVGTTKTMPDVAAGIMGEWDFVYAGIAVHHINEPVTQERRDFRMALPRKYVVHMGCEFNLYKRYLFRKSLILSPNIIYQEQSDIKQINAGIYLSHQNLVTGMWLRETIGNLNHTFIFVAGYHNENYSFAYSYDFSMYSGGFRGLKTSSHEVTFSKNIQYKTKSRKKIRTIKSPKF